jgi:hypothetical protein
MDYRNIYNATYGLVQRTNTEAFVLLKNITQDMAQKIEHKTYQKTSILSELFENAYATKQKFFDLFFYHLAHRFEHKGVQYYSADIKQAWR